MVHKVRKGVEVTGNQCELLFTLMQREQGIPYSFHDQDNGKQILFSCNSSFSKFGDNKVFFAGTPRAVFEFLCSVAESVICSKPEYDSSEYATLIRSYARAVCFGKAEEAKAIYNAWLNDINTLYREKRTRASLLYKDRSIFPQWG